jgi:perosamine synthetase
MPDFKIPLYQPTLAGNEQANVMECLTSNWISSKGRFLGEFERKFADYTGSSYAVGVCNGTVALHLAAVALGLGPGDEVIVPTLTYIAPVNAITYTGATPVFVDSVAATWQMDCADVRRQITKRTRAILAVHLYGHPCNLGELRAIADEHRLFLIEDCAEAFGSRFQGTHVGRHGNIATYSFYGNKTITTGEGGMVVTDDKTLYSRLLHLRGQGLAAHREYWHDIVGYNYRMTNICAAIGLAQLEQADQFLSRKRAIALRYRAAAADCGLAFHEEAAGVVHSYWMSSVLVPDTVQRDPLREHLRQRGIETRPTFFPVHTMPMYSVRFQHHPIAESIGWRGINLPSWPGMQDADVQTVIEALRSFMLIHAPGESP